MSSPERTESTASFLLVAGLVAVLAALWLYGPAFHGGFIADDVGYVANNVYIQSFDWAHLKEVLDPGGGPALFTANYAPVHMLAVMLEWQAFGASTFGYHVVNALAHAAVAVLLVAFFLSTGIPRMAALWLGALFLVHPANVEAVAWIFQLKTILALGFALGALLLFPRHPLAATALYVLALLSKIAAVFALPVLAVQLWVDAGREGGPARRPWPWLAAWLGLFALCGWPEFSSFARYGNPAHAFYPDVWSHLRSMVAVGARYLVMAVTSLGVSAFQQPAPSGPLDPWWLGGLVVLPLLAWRMVVVLVRRSEEAVYWVWAVAAFAPVSQIFPFLYPVGDRYLYTILPGLLGGGFLLGREALERFPRLQRRESRAPAAVVAVALVGVFAWHASMRVPLWRAEALVDMDAASHYPDGQIGLYFEARRAVQAGDAATALRSLQRLADTGFDGFQGLQGDPAFGALRATPQYAAILRQVAGNWIQAVSNRRRLLQPELLTLAMAHEIRGERKAAIAACETALQQGGPYDQMVQAHLEALRQQSGG